MKVCVAKLQTKTQIGESTKENQSEFRFYSLRRKIMLLFHTRKTTNQPQTGV